MKTVNQIVEEYLNRKKTPVYSLLVVVDAKGKSLTFNDVTNLKEINNEGRWIEFDSVYEYVNRHVRIYNGHVINYIENIPEEEQSMFIAKDCVSVTIYTHLGQREDYLNVKNLTASKKGRSVEFDRVVGEDNTHVWRSGAIEKYEERINDSNDQTR